MAPFAYPGIILAFARAGYEIRDELNGYSFVVKIHKNIGDVITRADFLAIADIIRGNRDVECWAFLEHPMHGMRGGKWHVQVQATEARSKAIMKEEYGIDEVEIDTGENNGDY